MLDIDQLTREKSHDQENWRKTLEFSRQSLPAQILDDKSFIIIAKASSSPEQFTLISKMLYQYSKTHPHGSQAATQLFKNADSSSFSLTEWLAAIEVFYQWLKNEKRSTGFITMLGYLQCCGESPENKDIRQRFPELVQEMLTTYGYDG